MPGEGETLVLERGFPCVLQVKRRTPERTQSHFQKPPEKSGLVFPQTQILMQPTAE